MVNFAAESHVDRSIHGPEDFIQTNIVGTFRLLEAARAYWNGLAGEAKDNFRFLHVSTDEVYGSSEGRPRLRRDPPLRTQQPILCEQGRQRPPRPRLPPHLRPAGHHQQLLQQLRALPFPGKAHPADHPQCLGRQALPIYGDGQQIRDWLYVKDHCSAIRRVLEAGRVGKVYNVGGWHEKPNLDVVHTLCAILDELSPRADGKPYKDQITYVKDRPGHDRRYAIDASKIERELGWKPAETFETGIKKTVQWISTTRHGLAMSPAAHTRTGSASSTGIEMKLLLTGKNGQVGFELQRSLAPLGEVVAVDMAECDLLAPKLSANWFVIHSRRYHQSRRLHCRRSGRK